MNITCTSRRGLAQSQVLCVFQKFILFSEPIHFFLLWKSLFILRCSLLLPSFPSSSLSSPCFSSPPSPPPPSPFSSCFWYQGLNSQCCVCQAGAMPLGYIPGPKQSLLDSVHSLFPWVLVGKSAGRGGRSCFRAEDIALERPRDGMD